jgi:radical SAM protein with 4Fe4S-binding SPASM domain
MYDLYTLMVTSKCFLSCSHCTTAASRGARYGKPAMTLPEMKAITNKILELTDRNCDINWGGGDPLVLGRLVMERIVSLPCFDSPQARNALYSTLMLPDLDSSWLDILNRFQSVMFSLDSYRTEQPSYRPDRAMGNLRLLSTEKNISYTPRAGDNIDDFYLAARDLGAARFHMGFLYGQDLPPELYIRQLDRLFELQAVHKTPRVGYFSRGRDITSIRSLTGWTAYSCFTSGAFISPDLVITSCFVLYQADPRSVPHLSVREFLSRDRPFSHYNRDFLRHHFLTPRRHCARCRYYPLCMGGCPYFSRGRERDIYCAVYKRIFAYLTEHEPPAVHAHRP